MRSPFSKDRTWVSTDVGRLLFFAFKGCSADCMVGTDIDLLRAAPDAGY